MKSNDVRAFWSGFSREAPSIAMSLGRGDMRAAFEATEKLLQSCGLDFMFELARGDDECFFILTPEGDREAGALIDEIVNSKPQLCGWRVFGRRQQKHLQDALFFVKRIYGVDVSDVVFEVLCDEGGLAVKVITAAAAKLSADEAAGLAATLLDHLLGEDAVMKAIFSIRCTSVSPASLASAISPEELVALFETRYRKVT